MIIPLISENFTHPQSTTNLIIIGLINSLHFKFDFRYKDNGIPQYFGVPYH